jgi:tetratricopeptide (TPR) repeat protein
MDDPTWDEIAELFDAALAMPPERREAHVREVAGDSRLAHDVLAMLAVHDDNDTLAVERLLLAVGGAGDDSALPPGTRIGTWLLEELAGRGGMGDVYRARRANAEFEQVVALKLMRPDNGVRDSARRFQAERIALARLTHPNISGIIDGGTHEDGRPWFVMPFIAGALPITRYCEQHHLPLEQRLALFITVAEAVHHAHVRLIVHRDLKPSNILVDEEGRPVLLDFGIAKILGSDRPDDAQTKHRLLTPEHAAPEQVRGEPVSTATDVYGLGVLLYELVAGALPFAGQRLDPHALERAILEAQPPLPSERSRVHGERSRVRGDLDRIVLMALRKEPDRRYASAEQFAQDVRDWLAQLPVRAQRDTLGYRLRRFAQRNRAAVTLGIVAFLLVLVAAAEAARQAVARGVERDRARQEAANAEDVVAVLTDLLTQSDPRVIPGGDTMRVAAFLDRAEARLPSLSAQAARQLRLLRVLAEVRASRGEYARAESLLRAGVSMGGDAPRNGPVELLRVRHALARVVAQGRDARTALAMFDSVRRDLAKLPEATDDDVAAVLLDIAGATRDPDRAWAALDTVVRLRSRGSNEDSVQVAQFLDAQATALRQRGHYAEARRLYQASAAILDRKLARANLTRLGVLGDLAVAELDLANWDAADTLVAEIVRQLPSDSTGIEGRARTMELWASVHANRGEHARAVREELESIGHLARRLPGGHELLDNSRRNLAIMLSASGRPSDGLALLDSVIASRRVAGDSASVAYMSAQRVPMLLRLGRAGEALRTVAPLTALLPAVPPNSRWHADAALYLGMASLANGRAESALPALQRALTRYEESYSDVHPRRAMARCVTGAALVTAGRRAEGAPLLVPACDIHRRWGLADPTVVAWGEAAGSR